MPQEEASVRDQIREALRADPQLLMVGLANFAEATGIRTHGSELWKMKHEVKKEQTTKKRKRKKANNVTKAMRLQVAVAALRPLMEKEGLEELTILRNLETGEMSAEVREAPPPPMLIKVG